MALPTKPKLMLPCNVVWSLVVLVCFGLLQKLDKQRENVDNWNGYGGKRRMTRTIDCLLVKVELSMK